MWLGCSAIIHHWPKCTNFASLYVCNMDCTIAMTRHEIIISFIATHYFKSLRSYVAQIFIAQQDWYHFESLLITLWCCNTLYECCTVICTLFMIDILAHSVMNCSIIQFLYLNHNVANVTGINSHLSRAPSQ